METKDISPRIVPIIQEKKRRRLFVFGVENKCLHVEIVKCPYEIVNAERVVPASEVNRGVVVFVIDVDGRCVVL